MLVATVVLDIPTQALDQGYSYEVPASLAASARVGSAVLVGFGRRDAVGFIVAVADVEQPGEEGSSRKLKPIKEVLTEPYFTELGARCAQFLAQHYLAPLSSCVHLFTPPGGIPKMERINGSWQLTLPATQPVDERWVERTAAADAFTPRKTAVKQLAILQALEQGTLRVSELRAEYGSVDSVLKALEAKGVIRVVTRRRNRADQAVSEVFAARVQHGLTLTDEQAHALDVIKQALDRRDGSTIVLDGVTGSGKTEVFLCAIEQVLSAGKNAIVLVPEISLTPQTVARFRGRFGDTVAVLHSRMSNGERFDQWDIIRAGQARVVVGARSALFAPLRNIGIIIIDEEHETSYKQDQAPRYVTRDVAAWMAREQGATLVLGSATPSIEALYACRHDDRWHQVEMHKRANGKPLPAIEVVDMAREFGGGNRKMFSQALQTALFDTLAAQQKAVLLLNQRGFAQFLLCRDCGFVPMCESCSTSLTYHEQGNRLICHHCGYTQSVMPVCPRCQSPYLKRFGAGTQRVEAELRSLLAGRACEIIRMDADTTARKGDHQRLLERFAQAQSAVLLGTQMIAKGLDFDEVTLVGVINADTMLRLPDFRSAERTFGIIEQVAGRCGRGTLPGRVIVQTYCAQEPAITCAAHYDRAGFLDHELPLRKLLRYPPYVRLINILMWGRNEQEVRRVGAQLHRDLEDLLGCDRHGVDAGAGTVAGLSDDSDVNSDVTSAHALAVGSDHWELFAPTPCALSRLKGVWRYHVLIKAPLGYQQSDRFTAFSAYIRSRKPHEGVQFSVDIDPMSLI